MFLVTVAIGILAAALFGNFYVSLKDFLHRLFDVFSHHFVEFYHDWKPSWPSILGISLHTQDHFSYKFNSFPWISSMISSSPIFYAVLQCGGNRAK